jgi:hypothetical protein
MLLIEDDNKLQFPFYLRYDRIEKDVQMIGFERKEMI